ncbi:hypothetical protein ADM99_04980 [Leptolinea tardivitalis]|uniref:SpoVT-AbrB domain-containing protein n=1 Tax=Leptolinea tardivitalis TaxID=229920 RepID=A0A0P6XU63_9CHLR|nr:hypothetical protein ADM99_04980 [Leptolinea tardivitalis]
MKKRISKWGSGYGIRVPKSILNKLGLSDGDEVFVNIENEQIVIKPLKNPSPSFDELVSKITPENIHKEIDFGPRIGNEFW